MLLHPVKQFPLRAGGRMHFHSFAPLFNAHCIKLSKPFALGSTPLDPKLRPGYAPLYEAPSHTAISVAKRTCLGFGFVGLYIAELMYSSPTLSSELGYAVGALSIVPLPLVHYFTQNYVARLFRLYKNDSATQELDDLVSNETLLVEKITFTGRAHYHTLIVTKDLQLNTTTIGRPWVTWRVPGESFYVKDDVGGMKMERLWGIAEKNSGVMAGRSFQR